MRPSRTRAAVAVAAVANATTGSAVAAAKKSGGGAGKLRLDVIRVAMANKEKRQNVMLPFWGRVVCEKVAMSLNKTFCLPIGDNNSLGPKLFIEGMSNNDIKYQLKKNILIKENLDFQLMYIKEEIHQF